VGEWLVATTGTTPPWHFRDLSQAGIRARKFWRIAFPGSLPVALWYARTCLPLRGQQRNGLFGDAPLSRLTALGESVRSTWHGAHSTSVRAAAHQAGAVDFYKPLWEEWLSPWPCGVFATI